MLTALFIYFVIIVAAVWATGMLLSRRLQLPCPAWLGWLVEMENPLARAARAESVIRQLGAGAGARVADIGCGPGRVTIPLARAVGPEGEVVAMDVQAAMLAKVKAKAEKLNLENIRLLQADAREGALAARSLDGAVAVMALGEMPGYERTFSMIHSALKQGGQLLIAESAFDPHFISREKVRDAAAAAGFVEKNCEGNFLAYAVVFEKPACP